MESEVENMEYATLEESEEEIESTEVTPQEQASKVVEITVSEVVAEVKTEDTEKNAEGKEEDPFSGGCEPSSKRVPQKGKKVKKPKKKASTKKVQEKEETEPIPLAKTSSSKQKKTQKLLMAVEQKFGSIPTGFEWMNHAHPILEEFNNHPLNQKPIKLGLMKDKESEMYLRRLELQNYKLEHGVKRKNPKHSIRDEIKALTKLNDLICQSKQVVEMIHEQRSMNDEQQINDQLEKYLSTKSDETSVEEDHSHNSNSFDESHRDPTLKVVSQKGEVNIVDNSQEEELKEEEIPLLIDQQE